MKKSISILLCCVLILSSSSFAFAEFGTGDSTNLSNIKTYVQFLYNNAATAQQISNIVSYLSSIVTHTSNSATRLSSIVTNTQNAANNILDVYNRLQFNGYSISNISYSIFTRLGDINSNLVTLMGWLDPNNNGGSMQQILQNIYNELIYTVSGSSIGHYISDISTGITQTASILTGWSAYIPALNDLKNSNTNVYQGIFSGINAAASRINMHRNLFRSYNGYDSGVLDTGQYRIPYVGDNGNYGSDGFYWTNGTPFGNIALLLQSLNYNIVDSYRFRWVADLTGYNSTRSYINPLTLQSSSFTPTSSINGLYQYLQTIQAPAARLAYVLANDQEIEARDAAAQNQSTVVDNFIDSSGNGSASTNDFTSISSASDGFKTNFNSGASAGGIWDVFNSDHGNWFSQSIADSLDTSGSSTRLLKSSSSFDTPLLDQQIDDIYKALGVMSDD